MTRYDMTLKFKVKNANGTAVTLQSAMGKRQEQMSLEFSLKCSQTL